MKSASEVVYSSYSEILPKDLRDSVKQNDRFWICQCPKCIEEGYFKEKLYLSKDLSFAWCFKCNRVFYDKYSKFTHPEIKSSELTFLNSSSFNDNLNEFKMSKYYDLPGELDDKAVDYLKNTRGNMYLVDNYLEYGIRSDSTGIYFPYEFFGEYRYWTKRLYSPIGSMKYFLPPIKTKPFYFIDRNSSKYIICEGSVDAIMISLFFKDYSVIAISGSSMSNPQVGGLRDLLPEEITIWLDKTELSLKLKDNLKSRIPYAYFKIVESDGSDPEETLLKKYPYENYKNKLILDVNSENH
jgi:hypothetical protein